VRERTLTAQQAKALAAGAAKAKSRADENDSTLISKIVI